MNATAPALPELAGDLWRVAQAAAGSRGFQFTSECANQMQNFIRTGVVTLSEDRALENPMKIAETKDGIVRLVGKMIELAIEQQRGQTVEATRTRMLHEHHFFSAWGWFCPCYPFC